jgi:hypothetical protein
MLQQVAAERERQRAEKRELILQIQAMEREAAARSKRPKEFDPTEASGMCTSPFHSVAGHFESSSEWFHIMMKCVLLLQIVAFRGESAVRDVTCRVA